MEEDQNLAGAGDSSRLGSSFEKVGDRKRFTVELRPGETTIVSWKKLMKDVSRANAQAPSAAVTAATAPAEHLTGGAVVHPALESRLAPAQSVANDLNGEAPSNRMSAVIEKIERLYMGKDSSDEDLDDIPDDDQYDTEDSFIDDVDLDEYFEVDKSKTKHDGFFVNRGKLESLEPSLSSDHLPKKRRRKAVENDLSDVSNKNLKVGRRGGGKRPLAVSGGNSTDRHKSGVFFSNASGSNLKEENFMEDSEKSILQRDKNVKHEQFDLNIACGAQPVQTAKTSMINRKEGSGLRPKGNMLDKAIRELEKTVAELRPRNGELPDVDATCQGVKRRLPGEIKEKLVSVARAVQVSHGKISQELLFRLMNIVGHVINLRTLKRNLKIMINTSLSANQEKDDKFQMMKKDIVDMIRARAPSLVAKAGEHAGTSDEFQDPAPLEKGVAKKCTMDVALEDKISDLYEIFVEDLDEDGTSQVRKFYAELAELWPKGVMDNHGIKRAICHARDRRKGLHDRNKNREKIQKKKLMATKVEEVVRVDPSSVAQPQYVQERVSSEFGCQVASPRNMFTSSTCATTSTSVAVITANSTNFTLSSPSVVTNTSRFDWPKHEKFRGPLSGSRSSDTRGPGAPQAKKVKRKPEINMGEAHCRSEKVSSQQRDERHESHKHHSSGPRIGLSQKSSSQVASMQVDIARGSLGQGCS